MSDSEDSFTTSSSSSDPENLTSDPTFYAKVDTEDSDKQTRAIASRKTSISKVVKKVFGSTSKVTPIVADETMAEKILKDLKEDMQDISLQGMDENPFGKITRKSYIRKNKATDLIESWTGPFKLVRIFNKNVCINYIHVRDGQELKPIKLAKGGNKSMESKVKYCISNDQIADYRWKNMIKLKRLKH